MTLRNVPFSPPDISEGEAEAVKQAVLSGWITTGPRTKELEKRLSAFYRTRKTVCLNSATAAMEMALRLLGIGPGDEVIVPAYTYTASASVVAHAGATIRMVDIQPDRLEMDYESLAEAINERTKAIIPVDLAGIVCDYERLFAIVNQPAIKALYRPSNAIQEKLGRVAIVADCAHALGSERHGKRAGEIADFSSFSFHAVKNFTTAEGGALTWRLPFGEEDAPTQQEYFGSPIPYLEGETWDEMLYRVAQLFSLHGQNKDAMAKTQLGAWEYDIIGAWYKCNMTDIAAALGLAQLERYPDMLAKRKRYIERLDAAMASLNERISPRYEIKTLNHYGPVHASSGHLYIVRIMGMSRAGVNGVMGAMAERGIATNVHYKPLPMMTAYKALGFDIADYPNALASFENEITLPLNTKMTDEDITYVIEHFTDILLGPRG